MKRDNGRVARFSVADASKQNLSTPDANRRGEHCHAFPALWLCSSIDSPPARGGAELDGGAPRRCAPWLLSLQQQRPGGANAPAAGRRGPLAGRGRAMQALPEGQQGGPAGTRYPLHPSTTLTRSTLWLGEDEDVVEGGAAMAPGVATRRAGRRGADDRTAGALADARDVAAAPRAVAREKAIMTRLRGEVVLVTRKGRARGEGARRQTQDCSVVGRLFI